jgi:hypothetical protein
MKHWIEGLEQRWFALPERRRRHVLLGALAATLALVTLTAFMDVVHDETVRATAERPSARGAPDASAPGAGADHMR